MILSLSEAIRSDRLEEFIAQEEARGVGPADSDEVMQAIETVARPPQSEDQTSRSPSRDDSNGRRIRRGT
jgi:hypothetical protein